MTFQGRCKTISGEVQNDLRGGAKRSQGRCKTISGEVQNDLRGGAPLPSNPAMLDYLDTTLFLLELLKYTHYL
jgi:hypothetical protein